MTDTRKPALLALAFIFILALAFWPSPAQANVDCDANGSINFGTSQSGTGSVNYSCRNYGSTAVNLTLCTVRGPVAWPGTEAQPAMAYGNNLLYYNLYTSINRAQIWDSSAPISTAISIAAGGTRTGTLSFYGYIPSGQTAPPGTYQTWFYNATVGILVAGNPTCQRTYTNFAGRDFNMPVTATVINACTITAGAGSNINFGVIQSTATNRSASSQIAVNCPSGTPYNIGLAPSNGDINGAGVMSGSAGNTAKVPYQLRKTSSTGPAWGNTATSSSTGNGVTGTGTGTNSIISVYATLPSANYPADNYRDTVTVTVHY
ncbi:Csu type fimbrial protein [Parasphingorhabdus sp.]|uniref:Csu type fimbrial protein n=1 Tax=Parasphingorhabdus sp. TaxID=2709688 RepID=UPI002F945B1C